MTSVDDLDIIKRAKRPPERGLGSVLFKLTGGGRINTGQSAAELEHQALVRRANRTVRGVYKIAFISLKVEWGGKPRRPKLSVRRSHRSVGGIES